MPQVFKPPLSLTVIEQCYLGLQSCTPSYICGILVKNVHDGSYFPYCQVFAWV